MWRYGYEALCKARDSYEEVSSVSLKNGNPDFSGPEETGTAKKCGNVRIHVISRYPEILDSVAEDGVYSPESEKGKSFSVKAACAAAGRTESGDKLLFLTADQPGIGADTIIQLLNTELAASADGKGPLIACASDGENDGNPVVFSACLVPELMALEGDMGGKFLFRKYPDRLVRIITAKDELRDVDTCEDMNELKKKRV